MDVLGISAFHQDSAAVLLRDGRPLAAAQEERFSHIRSDSNFPRRAVRYVLREADLASAREVDWVVFYEKPLRKFERLLVCQLQAFPRSAKIFSRGMFQWLGDRLWTKNLLCNELGIEPEQVLFSSHHQSHAASACYASGFDRAACLVADGSGEWTTTSLAAFENGQLEMLLENAFPHSLGLFYAAFTQFLGFEADLDGNKIEELAAYGKPTFRDSMNDLIQREDGALFKIDQGPFRFSFDPEHFWRPELEECFGPARKPAGPLAYQEGDSRHADLAASLLQVVGDTLLHLLAELYRKVSVPKLCLAGELAALPALNARLLRESPFEEIFIAPAMGDAGGAFGAASLVAQAKGDPASFALMDLALGEHLLPDPGAEAKELADADAVRQALLSGLNQGPVAWLRDRFEWGPRCLGKRSLLADPRNAKGKESINQGLKHREDFRPFACAVPSEKAGDYFELPSGADRALRWKQIAVPVKELGREKAPAAVHVDGTAVPQLVDREADPELHALLTAFGEQSGVPILLQSSLDLRGDPMARGEAEARAFMERSQLRHLVVENRLYTQPD
ncbi:MAG: hypothetical protein DWQ01_08945 [Planctomycetota bacterium]|nr:MAG: hypothetical protein DWQ01_08945 [Planctomycetota bacterium]